jgi:hypothetical protein
MSMNFGREQALLRQRLTAAGSAEHAAARQAELGSDVEILGAADDEIRRAATDVADAYPGMGRAQMTAFVRTLWRTKIHELRAVGIEILALRAELLEPPDVPFLQGLLEDGVDERLAALLAGDVLGPLVAKNKKLWKELKRLASSADQKLRRAAVRASKAPVAADGAVFERFDELVTPLLAEADQDLQRAIDEALAAAAQQDTDAVAAFAQLHGRKVKLPKKRAKVVEVEAAAPVAKKKAAKASGAKASPTKKAGKKG